MNNEFSMLYYGCIFIFSDFFFWQMKNPNTMEKMCALRTSKNVIKTNSMAFSATRIQQQLLITKITLFILFSIWFSCVLSLFAFVAVAGVASASTQFQIRIERLAQMNYTFITHELGN